MTFEIIPAGANSVRVRPKSLELLKITTSTGRLIYQGLNPGSTIRLPPLEVGETMTCEAV